MVILLRNDIRLGFILGLLSPALSLIGYYYLKFYPVPFFSLYFNLLLTDHQFLREIATTFLMLSGLLFFLYVNGNRYKTATGIFIVTLACGLAVFLINALLV